MANINYTKVSWDTTKSLGPTNLNHMDDGIKSVCDKMDNIGDEVMGYEVTSTGPSHQIINATNATNATNDGTGTNIANQFSELNNKLTWQQIGEVTGANSVTVDSSAYKEFLVIQKYGDIEMSYIILASRMGTRTIDTYGGYTNNSYSVASCIKYNSTSIINSVLSQNSTSYISNTKMTVYAR